MVWPSRFAIDVGARLRRINEARPASLSHAFDEPMCHRRPRCRRPGRAARSSMAQPPELAPALRAAQPARDLLRRDPRRHVVLGGPYAAGARRRRHRAGPGRPGSGADRSVDGAQAGLLATSGGAYAGTVTARAGGQVCPRAITRIAAMPRTSAAAPSAGP